MQFRDIIGHKEAIARLRAMADRRQLPHALLFHGPSGVGKTAVARAFIQYLYCTARHDGDSCGRCPECLQTSKLNNPDVHYIFPVLKNARHPRGLSEEYSEEWAEMLEKYPYMPAEKWLQIIDAGNSVPKIYVDESKELLRMSSLSSYGNGYKIFMIWEPEKMNPETANKLLKVIEEPFSDTLFILVSNNPGALMPTIRSRLQAIEFTPLPDSEITEYLVRNGKTLEEAQSLARIAKGNMNRASQLALEGGEPEEFRNAFIGVMRACYARKMTELKAYADTFAAYGREKSVRLLDYFARMVRESFISNLRCKALEAMTPEEESFVARFGPFINEANVAEMEREIDEARNDITRNANQKIVFFDFLISLTRLIRLNGMNAAKSR